MLTRSTHSSCRGPDPPSGCSMHSALLDFLTAAAAMRPARRLGSSTTTGCAPEMPLNVHTPMSYTCSRIGTRRCTDERCTCSKTAVIVSDEAAAAKQPAGQCDPLTQVTIISSQTMLHHQHGRTPVGRYHKCTPTLFEPHTHATRPKNPPQTEPHLVLDRLQHEALVPVRLAHTQRRQRLQWQRTSQHLTRGRRAPIQRRLRQENPTRVHAARRYAHPNPTTTSSSRCCCCLGGSRHRPGIGRQAELPRRARVAAAAGRRRLVLQQPLLLCLGRGRALLEGSALQQQQPLGRLLTELLARSAASTTGSSRAARAPRMVQASCCCCVTWLWWAGQDFGGAAAAAAGLLGRSGCCIR